MNEERDPLLAQVAAALRQQRTVEQAADVPEPETIDAAMRERWATTALQQLKPARRRRPLWTGFIGAALAAAACVWLMVRPVTETLPRYRTELHGQQTVRSEATQDLPVQISGESRLDWLLRPERPVGTALTVRTFFRREQLQVWPVHYQVSEQGVVRISGRAADLRLPLGRCTLIVAISPLSDVPSDARLAAEQLQHPPAHWRILLSEVEILPPR